MRSAEQLANVVSSNLGQLVTLTPYDSQALYQNALQNATIICILEKISKQTCELLNQACLQTALQTEIAKNTVAVAEIIAMAHPETALMREREQAMRMELRNAARARSTSRAASTHRARLRNRSLHPGKRSERNGPEEVMKT